MSHYRWEYTPLDCSRACLQSRAVILTLLHRMDWKIVCQLPGSLYQATGADDTFVTLNMTMQCA